MDLSRFKKTVTSPFTAQEYEIVRVSQRDMFEQLGLLPIALAGPVDEALDKKYGRLSDGLRQKLGDPLEEAKTRKFVLENGVIRPRIWFGEEASCPDDALPHAYLGDDKHWLMAQVVEFTFDFPALKMDKFFRGNGAGDPGPDGPEVRGEAVQPA